MKNKLYEMLTSKSGRIYILAFDQSQFDTARRKIYNTFPEFIKDQKIAKFVFIKNNDRGADDLRGTREPVIINCLELRDKLNPQIKHMMDVTVRSHDYLIKDVTDILESMKGGSEISEVMTDIFNKGNAELDARDEFQKLLGNL